MTSLAEAAASPRATDLRSRCGTANWIRTLIPSEAAGAQTLLDDPNRSTAEIFRLFADNGFTLRYNAVRMHRTGVCSCP